MTIPDALLEIDRYVTAWQADEILALREGDAARVHDCRIRIGVLEYLASELREKQQAAA